MGWINFLMEEADGYNMELILKKVVRPFKVYDLKQQHGQLQYIPYDQNRIRRGAGLSR